MKIKIISDGTSGGTQIIDAETGQAVEGVTAVLWQITGSRGLAQVALTFEHVEIEAIGDAGPISQAPKLLDN
jgi:hypothetical protein